MKKKTGFPRTTGNGNLFTIYVFMEGLAPEWQTPRNRKVLSHGLVERVGQSKGCRNAGKLQGRARIAVVVPNC
jgi:hypothetical protein